MVTLSSNLVWKIPWLEEPGTLQSGVSEESNMTQGLNKQQNVCWSLKLQIKAG